MRDSFASGEVIGGAHDGGFGRAIADGDASEGEGLLHEANEFW